MRKFLPYILASLSCALIVLAAYLWLFPGYLDTFIGGIMPQNLPMDIGKNPHIDVSPNILVSRADDAFASGNLSGAMELYERVLESGSYGGNGTNGGPYGKMHDSDVPIIRKLFDISLTLGDFAKAQSAIGLMSFRGISDSMLDPLRGLLLLREGKIEDAELVFKSEPSRPENAYGLVLINILTGDHEAAKKSIVAMSKSSDPALMQASQSIQGAYDEFALFEDGKEIHLDTLLARALAQIGQCPISISLLENVVAKEPDYRDAWIVLGYCNLTLQKNENALADFEKAYRLDPQKSETQYFLGIAHENLGNDAEAGKFFEYALINGFQPRQDVQKRLAALSEKSGDYESAVKYYRDIVYHTDPVDFQAVKSLVFMLLEHTDEVEEARSVVESARDNFEITAEMLDLDGWTSFAENNKDRAASLLLAAIRQDVGLATAWYHKGVLDESISDRRSALESYKKAYALSVGVDDELALKAAEKYNALTKKPR